MAAFVGKHAELVRESGKQVEQSMIVHVGTRMYVEYE